MVTTEKILLADDENTFLEATKELIQEQGYDCVSVKNAKELALALEHTEFDLLITDLNMPGNQVLETMEQLRAVSFSLPIIVITGFPSIPTAVESIRLKVFEYLIKPFEFSALLHAIQKGIQQTQTLKLIQKTRQEVEDRARGLYDIEKSLPLASGIMDQDISNYIGIDPSFKKLQTQLDGLSELLISHQTALPTQTAPNESSVGVLSSSEYFRLREGLYQTIQVLEQTKKAFHSKDLGILRRKLQTILNETPVPS